MKKATVAHVVFPYLFRTGSWIYGQVVNLHQYRPIVLTDRTENLDLFPFRPVYSYDDLSRLAKLWIRLRDHGFHDYYHNFFYGLLKKHKAVLIHCHFGPLGVLFLREKTKLQIPMVTTFYGEDMSRLPRDPDWREKYATLFAEGECFLTEGAHMKRGLVELGCPEEKVVVQHLGVDLEDAPLLPRSIGPDGMVHILVAGTFREKKGIPYALEAFARIRERHQRVRLTLLGDSSGQLGGEEEKQKIIGVLERHHLHDSTRWLGFQPYPVFREMLRTHHLFLSPSVTAEDGDSEGGCPVSITEAQGTGMPVVSTFHADIPEVVLHGKTGLLSPERDVEALAANLEYLVTHPDLWPEMGRRAREHVEQEYNVKVQVRRLEEHYTALLMDKPFV